MHSLYTNISYSYKEEQFSHNIPEDYACFALWKSAWPFKEQIRNYLALHFDIVLDTEIEWSDENFHENAIRLYEEPLFYLKDKSEFESDHANKIGANRFRFFIVRDHNPFYTYAQSVSKKIELSNLNIVNAKYLFREWVFKATGEKYSVHSTNSISEFFFQAPLIVGMDTFNEILAGKRPVLSRIRKDLEGANGWNSWAEMFGMLNITSKYLVLRNFKGMPLQNMDDDLDILTDNYQKAASALGVIQDQKKPYKGYVRVQSQKVPIDIRYVGDNYYNTSWEKDMLSTRIYNNGVFIPRNDHYFFSLLVHCRIQKLEVKEKYITELTRLAWALKLTWFTNSVFTDSKITAEIINGFFEANGYHYEDPVDTHVEINRAVTSRLIRKGSVMKNDFFVLSGIKRFIRSLLPDSIVAVMKQIIGRNREEKKITLQDTYKSEVISGRST